MNRRLYPARRVCLTVNFLVCSVCQKWCVYSQHWPVTVLQYDIPCEGEFRPDEIPIEVAPCDECLREEVELNTVVISNMSIDIKSVETDGKRGRHREITVDFGAGESVVNPDELPNVDLKPSKRSVKGPRYVCPRGAKIDNLGELTVKVQTEQNNWSDISIRVFPRSQSPQALACSVEGD